MNSWRERIITAEEAAQKVQSGNRVFITGNCSTPREFIRTLRARAEELQEVELIQVLTIDNPIGMTPELAKHIRINSLFLDGSVRNAVNEGYADFTPVFLSHIPRLFANRRIILDVCVIHVSPPDKHGFCSYGLEVGITKSAAECAGIVIAEVNPNMPRTHGDSFIHVSQISHFIEVDYAITELIPEPSDPIQDKMAQFIAELVPDGATLQTGIGGIPNAVLGRLTGHKNLGIHTELFSDGVMDMIEAGVITNAAKTFHPGKVVAGFVLGTRKLYDYIHDNPVFELHPTAYVNDSHNISRNDRMISINSAIEVDLTGQVCADSIGTRFYSGVGGQLDFVRGAMRSKDGKAIIALPSTTKNDTISRIVPTLNLGAGVTTTRNHGIYVVTEYGVADLFGRTISERIHALVNIAHPKFRDELMAFARNTYKIGRVF